MRQHRRVQSDAAGRRDSFGRRIEVFQNQVHSNPIATCNLLPDVLPLVPGQLPGVAAFSRPVDPLPNQAAIGRSSSGKCLLNQALIIYE